MTVSRECSRVGWMRRAGRKTLEKVLYKFPVRDNWRDKKEVIWSVTTGSYTDILVVSRQLAKVHNLPTKVVDI